MRTVWRTIAWVAIFLSLCFLVAAANAAYYQNQARQCHTDGGDRVNGVCQKVMP